MFVEYLQKNGGPRGHFKDIVERNCALIIFKFSFRRRYLNSVISSSNWIYLTIISVSGVKCPRTSHCKWIRLVSWRSSIQIDISLIGWVLEINGKRTNAASLGVFMLLEGCFNWLLKFRNSIAANIKERILVNGILQSP